MGVVKKEEEIVEDFLRYVKSWACSVCDKKIIRKDNETGIQFNDRVFKHVEKHIKKDLEME